MPTRTIRFENMPPMAEVMLLSRSSAFPARLRPEVRLELLKCWPSVGCSNTTVTSQRLSNGETARQCPVWLQSLPCPATVPFLYHSRAVSVSVPVRFRSIFLLPTVVSFPRRSYLVHFLFYRDNIIIPVLFPFAVSISP